MKTCCNCGVANPGCLTLCYSCGKPVAAKARPRPVEMTRQCTYCGAPNLETSPNCFACGDPLQRTRTKLEAPAKASSLEARYDSWENGDPQAWREVERRLRAPADPPQRPRSWWQRLAPHQA